MRRFYAVFVALLLTFLCACGSSKNLVLTADALAELSDGGSLNTGDTIILSGKLEEVYLSKAFISAVADGVSYTISCEFDDASELSDIPNGVNIALMGVLDKIAAPTIYIRDAKMIGIITDSTTIPEETTATVSETTTAAVETTTTAVEITTTAPETTTTAIETTTTVPETTTTTIETTAANPETNGTEATSQTEISYILNTSTMKYHLSGCSSIEKIKDKNKAEFVGSRDELIAQGYTACKLCCP